MIFFMVDYVTPIIARIT